MYNKVFRKFKSNKDSFEMHYLNTFVGDSNTNNNNKNNLSFPRKMMM